MPKMKTNRAAAKRFRSNGGGSLRHGRTNKRHLLTHKSARRRRQLRGCAAVGKSNLASLKAMLPYS